MLYDKLDKPLNWLFSYRRLVPIWLPRVAANSKPSWVMNISSFGSKYNSFSYSFSKNYSNYLYFLYFMNFFPYSIWKNWAWLILMTWFYPSTCSPSRDVLFFLPFCKWDKSSYVISSHSDKSKGILSSLGIFSFSSAIQTKFLFSNIISNTQTQLIK